MPNRNSKKYLPGRRLPLVDRGAHQEDVVPELLQHLDLLAALLQQPEFGNLDLEQRRGVLNVVLEEDHHLRSFNQRVFVILSSESYLYKVG